MATVSMNTSENFTLLLTSTEGMMVSKFPSPGQAKAELETQITDWIRVKDHQRAVQRNRNVLNKMLSADSSTQQAVIDLLFST